MRIFQISKWQNFKKASKIKNVKISEFQNLLEVQIRFKNELSELKPIFTGHLLEYHCNWTLRIRQSQKNLKSAGLLRSPLTTLGWMVNPWMLVNVNDNSTAKIQINLTILN